jgi:hypothetical protein
VYSSATLRAESPCSSTCWMTVWKRIEHVGRLE